MTETGTAVARLDYRSVEIQSTGFGGLLMPKSLGELVAFAEIMAKANVGVPKHLRGDVGACISVCMQALRLEWDPFALANQSFSVNDRIAYMAQAVSAMINTRAPIRGRPKYEFTGEEGTTRQCKVTVVTREDGEVLDYTSPKVSKIQPKNSPLWKVDEDQQLGYFAIRALTRRHFPEVIMGVYDTDEAAGMRDVTPPATSGISERLEAHGHLKDNGFKDGQVDQTLDRPLDPGIVDAIVEAQEPGRPRVKRLTPAAVGLEEETTDAPKRRGRPKKYNVPAAADGTGPEIGDPVVQIKEETDAPAVEDAQEAAVGAPVEAGTDAPVEEVRDLGNGLAAPLGDGTGADPSGSDLGDDRGDQGAYGEVGADKAVAGDDPAGGDGGPLGASQEGGMEGVATDLTDDDFTFPEATASVGPDAESALERIDECDHWLNISQTVRGFSKTDGWRIPADNDIVLRRAWARFKELGSPEPVSGHMLLMRLWLFYGAESVQQIDEVWPMFFRSAYANASRDAQTEIAGVMAKRKAELSA